MKQSTIARTLFAPSGSVLHTPGNCPPERLDQLVFIQISLNQGRSVELKTDFYRQLTQAIVATGFVESENVFINLVEVARENWSFGVDTGSK